MLILLIFLTFLQISKTLTQNIFFFCVRENENCVRVFKIYCDKDKKFKKIKVAKKCWFYLFFKKYAQNEQLIIEFVLDFFLNCVRV